MFPLSFLFHLSSTPRDRMRASPDPFSRCARVSPRESPLSAVPVPPRWLKKQTLPRAQKKREKKISGRYPLKLSKKECAARGKVPVLSSRNLETYESSSTGPFFCDAFRDAPVRFARRVRLCETYFVSSLCSAKFVDLLRRF